MAGVMILCSYSTQCGGNQAKYQVDYKHNEVPLQVKLCGECYSKFIQEGPQ